MPLLTEREHMQLWCPEARVVVVDVDGPKVATPEFQGMGANQVEASPALNRMDMGGLRIPQTCLCFGSNCGAWQWASWHKGRDGKHYSDADRALGQIKPDAFPLAQIGYCGKAAGGDPTLPAKPTSLPAPANDAGDTSTTEAPKKETLQ